MAAADGLSVDQLAAANGISATAGLLAGSPLTIPPQTPGVVAGWHAGTATGSAESGETAQTGTRARRRRLRPRPRHPRAATWSARRHALGARRSQRDDRDQLAADNGLSASGILLAGSTLNIGAAAECTVERSVPAPGGAQPTPDERQPQRVGQVAADNGVSPSLAEAIGYQESGFNNSLVSATGAIGVMQIEPGTWSYIERNLAGSSLSPSSALDNVKGGVLLLHSLLDQTGGDPNLAVAGYYQGLRSVHRTGCSPTPSATSPT